MKTKKKGIKLPKFSQEELEEFRGWVAHSEPEEPPMEPSVEPPDRMVKVDFLIEISGKFCDLKKSVLFPFTTGPALFDDVEALIAKWMLTGYSEQYESCQTVFAPSRIEEVTWYMPWDKEGNVKYCE